MDKEVLRKACEKTFNDLFKRIVEDIESYKVDDSKPNEASSMLTFEEGWNAAINEILDYFKRGAKKDDEE